MQGDDTGDGLSDLEAANYILNDLVGGGSLTNFLENLNKLKCHWKTQGQTLLKNSMKES